MSGPDNPQTKTSLFRKFPIVFWVVQSFELMERGAYYVYVPIIAVHAQYNVGLAVGLAATLTAFMYPLQYGLPILSGALGEKFGFKRQMILGFSVLFLAYLFLSFASSPITMILAVMMIGLGVGIYKPLVSATVAKATPQNHRNQAYAIYYWVVNLAAAISPAIFAILEVLGVITQSLYAWIFRICAFFFLINIIVAITLFKEIPRTGHVKTVGDALKNVRTALSDKKFLVMVLLIGGFWALYSTMLNVLPLTLMNFRLVPIWFTVLILAIPNPLTIILAGPFLTRILDKMESMVAIMAGVVLYVVGLGIIGTAGLTLNWVFAILGVIVASIGEFMVAPGYLSFVSKLAPKEKVSAYIGANFLATTLGLLGGTVVFGTTYSIIGPQWGMPKFFYGMLISLGLLLLTGFMFYYKSWGQEIIQRARKIRELEEGISEDVDPYDNPLSKGLAKTFGKRKTVFIAWAIIPIMLIATFSLGGDTYYPPEDEEDDGTRIIMEETTSQSSLTGNTGEGDVSEEIIPTKGILTWINISFTWQDEPAPFFQTNEPDTFEIELVSPNSTVDSDGPSANSASGSGQLSINYEVPQEEEIGDQDWTLNIRCIEAGDVLGPAGIIVRSQDTGNDWSVTIRVSFLEEVEEEIREEEGSS